MPKLSEIENLSFDDKMKVWIDYLVTTSCLNNNRELLTVTKNGLSFIDEVHFPILNAYWGKSHNINILNFDDFTNSEKCIKKVDYGTQFGGAGIQTNYTGIYDWFPKFKERIFKKQGNVKFQETNKF